MGCKRKYCPTVGCGSAWRAVVQPQPRLDVPADETGLRLAITGPTAHHTWLVLLRPRRDDLMSVGSLGDETEMESVIEFVGVMVCVLYRTEYTPGFKNHDHRIRVRSRSLVSCSGQQPNQTLVPARFESSRAAQSSCR